MSQKMKITISIEDENGRSYIEETRETDLPYIDEIDKYGFNRSFSQLETSVLETRKEVTNKIMEQYLEHIDKKKQKVKS